MAIKLKITLQILLLRHSGQLCSSKQGVTALRPVLGEKQNSSGKLEILPGIKRPEKFYGKNAVREVQILGSLKKL